MSKDEKLLEELRRRLVRKVKGKVWNMKADCTDQEVGTYTLSIDGVEQKGNDDSPEFLAFLALLMIGAAVTQLKLDMQHNNEIVSDISDKFMTMGDVLLELWDDSEKKRAVFLN